MALSSGADSLLTTGGEVHQGRVLHYDAYSYIVLPDEGGKVIVPRQETARIDRDREQQARYTRRAELVVSVERREQEEPPQWLLVGRMKDRGEQEKDYGLQVEAQTLLHLMESEERYADAYRTVHVRGGTRYELEYAWEKDLLVRRYRVPGQGVNLTILGPVGEGHATLLRAAKGRVREERSLLSRIYDPDRKLPERPRKAAPRQRSAW